MIGRAIHYNSKRAARRFAAINCSAIPGSLLVSEFFSHAKESLTGARISYNTVRILG
ncbi:MAG: sigma 54-interacting transcriptional regulator [Nitrospira sp.]